MKNTRYLLFTTIVVAATILGFLVWQGNGDGAVPEGFARGNGRVEAVEIDVASKLPGRIETIWFGRASLSRRGNRWPRLIRVS